jgi:acyl-coenzyme A thioesterase PaaI-like protein
MKTKNPSSSGLRRQVLCALALNRAAPLNFPSALMRLVARKSGSKHLKYEFDDGDWCRGADGEINLPAFGVFVDMALGGAARMASKTKHRVATVHLKIQFTGAPTHGHLTAKSEFVATGTRTSMDLALSRATVMSGKTLVAHTDGAFALIALPPDAKRHSLHWERAAIAALQPLPAESLEAHEMQIVQRYDEAVAAATPALPFVEHFWCGTPTAAHGKAHLDIAVSPHLGNRSGNVHGGMLIGMAARTANAAAPAGMRLSNLSSWFLSPGRGSRLEVRSAVIQSGRSIAVVRTEITGGDGKRVFEATSQHVVR